MSDLHPVEISREPERKIKIVWSDGTTQVLTSRQLRHHCPCATCRQPEKEQPASTSGLRVLSPAETIPLEIAGMQPVGNYAYSIQFSDGHNTGIFTFELLRRLAEK